MCRCVECMELSPVCVCDGVGLCVCGVWGVYEGGVEE